MTGNLNKHNEYGVVGRDTQRGTFRRSAKSPTPCSRLWLLPIDLQRFLHARMHVVSADQDGKLHDLPLVEMPPQIREHIVRHFDVARHRIGEGKRGAFAFAEQGRGAPIGQCVAFRKRHAVRQRKRGDVLHQAVLREVQIGDADDDDLAQPAIELRLPAHGVEKIEPGRGQRWTVQKQSVNIQQIAAAAAADLFDKLGRVGSFVFFQ